MLDAPTIKKTACDCGADLVGIASADRFSSLPPEANPLYIQPKAKSVIVLGFRIPRGSMRGLEEQTAWQTLGAVNPAGSICVESTYLFCRELESQGWETVPLVTQTPDLSKQGVRAHPDKPEPNVILDMDFAAHAAGLGEVGRGKFFLTREFGPRQIFTAVITDLDLDDDEPFSGSICDECGACAEACPANALDPEKVWHSPLAEGEATCYGLQIESCRICQTGTMPMPYTRGDEPCRIGAACGRACIAHLEDTGQLSRSFKSPFRDSASS